MDIKQILEYIKTTDPTQADFDVVDEIVETLESLDTDDDPILSVAIGDIEQWLVDVGSLEDDYLSEMSEL